MSKTHMDVGKLAMLLKTVTLKSTEESQYLSPTHKYSKKKNKEDYVINDMEIIRKRQELTSLDGLEAFEGVGQELDSKNQQKFKSIDDDPTNSDGMILPSIQSQYVS